MPSPTEKLTLSTLSLLRVINGMTDVTRVIEHLMRSRGIYRFSAASAVRAVTRAGLATNDGGRVELTEAGRAALDRHQRELEGLRSRGPVVGAALMGDLTAFAGALAKAAAVLGTDLRQPLTEEVAVCIEQHPRMGRVLVLAGQDGAELRLPAAMIERLPGAFRSALAEFLDSNTADDFDRSAVNLTCSDRGNRAPAKETA